MTSELEDLREAFHKLANRDFTDLVVSERAKGVADMRERAAKLAERYFERERDGYDQQPSDLFKALRALPLDGGDGE